MTLSNVHLSKHDKYCYQSDTHNSQHFHGAIKLISLKYLHLYYNFNLVPKGDN